MARKGYFYIKGEDVIVDTLKEFVGETEVIDTLSEFLERYLMLIMLAKDRNLFIEKFEKNLIKKDEETYRKIKIMLKLSEVMQFYNVSKDKFITKNSALVTVDELIEKGYRIKDKQLIINE